LKKRLQRVSEIVAQRLRAFRVVVKFIDKAEVVGLARAGERYADLLGHGLAPRMIVDDEALMGFELPLLRTIEGFAELRFPFDLARLRFLEEGRIVGQHQWHLV